jgi:hypothetical protein
MTEETNQGRRMTLRESWNAYKSEISIDWYLLGTIVASITIGSVVNNLPVREQRPKPAEAVRIEQIEGIQKVVADHLNGTDKFPAADRTNYFNATGFNNSLAVGYFTDLQKEKTTLVTSDSFIDYNKSVKDNLNDKKKREWQSAIAGLATFFLLIGGNIACRLSRRRK